MAESSTIPRGLRHLFPNAVPLEDYVIRDNGAGVFIAEWNLPDPQPDQAAIDVAFNDSLAAEATEKANRKGRKIAQAAQMGLNTPDKLQAFFEILEDRNLD